MSVLVGLFIFLICLMPTTGCTPTPQQKARLVAACQIGDRVVPLAQDVIANFGAPGATASAIDKLLVHPAIQRACAELKGNLIATVEPE